MTVIIVFTTVLYLMVLWKAYMFFRAGGPCRESDKTTVAVMTALSLMFAMSQVLVWGASPWEIHGPPDGNSLLAAFNFSNAFFYLGHIESLTGRKVCRVSHSN